MKKIVLMMVAVFALSSVASTAMAAWNGFGNRWDNGGRDCRAVMKTWRGQVIERFAAEQCRRAMRMCQRDLQRRQSMGMNPRAYCSIQGNSWDPTPVPMPREFVCTAMDNGWEEHFGGHKGYGRTRAQASQKAMRACLREHGECRISSCEAQ